MRVLEEERNLIKAGGIESEEGRRKAVRRPVKRLLHQLATAIVQAGEREKARLQTGQERACRRAPMPSCLSADKPCHFHKATESARGQSPLE